MNKSENTEILRVLVGSRAHGLDTPDSDYDFRSVFVLPTKSFFTLGTPKPAITTWVEGEVEDNTSYEVAHLLHLATKSNPSILEIFASPVVTAIEEGLRLRTLLPFVWTSKGVLDAFIGYSHSQQKKLMDEKYANETRKWKYAVAYLRVLRLAEELLQKGTMTIEVVEPWRGLFQQVREGELTIGRVVDIADDLKKLVRAAYEANPNHQTDFRKINEFLLAVRENHWQK